MKVKYNDSKTGVLTDTVDADTVKYTSQLVKFYLHGFLVEVYGIGDVVEVVEKEDD